MQKALGGMIFFIGFQVFFCWPGQAAQEPSAQTPSQKAQEDPSAPLLQKKQQCNPEKTLNVPLIMF